MVDLFANIKSNTNSQIVDNFKCYPATGSIRRPDHWWASSKWRVVESIAPSKAPASTKNPECFLIIYNRYGTCHACINVHLCKIFLGSDSRIIYISWYMLNKKVSISQLIWLETILILCQWHKGFECRMLFTHWVVFVNELKRWTQVQDGTTNGSSGDHALLCRVSMRSLVFSMFWQHYFVLGHF